LITETQFFHQIFEDFVCLEEDFHDNDVWKSKSIIKLMTMSGEIAPRQIVEEGLKVILSLCKFRERGYLIDPYESESYTVDKLAAPDKKLLYLILKAEFT
jgi:hypothetical protein